MPYMPCQKPKESALAIRGPIENIYAQLPSLDVHHAYWAKRMLIAQASANTALLKLCDTLHGELFESTAYFKAPIAIQREPRLVERDRRRAIGTLALSILMRQLLRPDLQYRELEAGVQVVDGNAVITDTMAGPDGMPLEHRVHVTPQYATHLLGDWPGDPDDSWYKSGTLYVQRVRPASPSEGLLAMFAGQVEINFSVMETLFPYVANFSAEL